jgi:lipid II:glycine glycyltransferase (peptidoglycan interpeptide bridge formation enzyme)
MDKIQENNFLQSEEWLKFQENTGRKTYRIESENFLVGIVEHELPIVGRYFYVPRGPIICHTELDSGSPDSGSEAGMTSVEIPDDVQKIIDLAKKENAGWIRIEPENKEALNLIKNNIEYKIKKAPHNMQPKEIFVIDISKSELDLLSEMKSKTRYNIKIAQKNGVFVKEISNFQFPISNEFPNSNDQKNTENYIDEFLKLTKEMAKRQGISAHPEEYYRKMFESLPEDMLKLYCAEYDRKIIAANLVLFFGNVATYLHGASSDEHRNVMAPYLLQWQAILDAKARGFTLYDFGGISTNNEPKTINWQGITKFKLGFSPSTQPIVFPGSYDIIINRKVYALYRALQYAKALICKICK